MSTAIIYGPPGSGKTVNSTRVPGENLLLSSDNSSIVLTHFERPSLTIKNVETFQAFVDAFETATREKKYEHIIVDCLTDLIDSYIVGVRESGFTGDIRQHYLAVYTKVKFLVRKAAFCGTHCIFNCWEEIDTVTLPSGEVVNRVSPMLPAKIKQQVCGLCNIVCYVTTATNKSNEKQWYYVTEGKPTIMAKDQLYLRKNCLPENIFNI